jgi:hypothetical protein
MSIRIRSTSLQATTPDGSTVTRSADGYLDKIVKSIPSQVIGFYTGAIVALGGPVGTVPDTSKAANPKLWIPFVLGLIFTPLLTYKQTHEPNKPPAYTQIIIATVSFVVWAFATGGPFASLSFWDPTMAGIVIGGYTLILGAIPQN